MEPGARGDEGAGPTPEARRIGEALAFVRGQTELVPRVMLMLGSGLGHVAELVDVDIELALGDIPHLPVGTVAGHAGALLLGHLEGLPVMVQRGRVHLYEGHAPAAVVRSVRLGRALGAQALVVTNAAGGIRDDLGPGDLMVIEDHLNLTGASPLRGPDEPDFGPRFPDMTTAYDPGLRELAARVAGSAGLPLARGVYAALPGPQYETPAEIRMLAAVGADAVGMSTVPEVIAAVHAGLAVLGVSCITNRAAGLTDLRPSHDEVLETSARAAASMGTLIRGLMGAWDVP